MRSQIVLVVSAVLVATWGLPFVTAHTSADPVAISLTKTIAGADTYMFSIQSSVSYNLLAGSYFDVQGTFPPNATNQDFGAIAGVVRFINEACPTAAGDDPCFVAMTGASIKDVGDLTVHQGTTTIKFDPNDAEWGGGTVGVSWDGTTGFQKPSGAGTVKFRYFISIPGASSIKVRIHFHSQQALSVFDEEWHSGGFMRVLGEDYDPDVLVDTHTVETAVGGEALINMGAATPLNRMYAMEAPTWFGVTVAQLGSTFVVTHNTAAVGNFGVELPNGQVDAGTAIAVGGTGGVAIVGSALTGTYRFFNNAYVGAGPQDLYTVGFIGPISA